MEGLSLSSPFWSQVQERLEAAGSLVSAFQLACEAHQKLIPVACVADFQNLKERTPGLFVFWGLQLVSFLFSNSFCIYIYVGTYVRVYIGEENKRPRLHLSAWEKRRAGEANEITEQREERKMKE
jgi:hypothetical protein